MNGTKLIWRMLILLEAWTYLQCWIDANGNNTGKPMKNLFRKPRGLFEKIVTEKKYVDKTGLIRLIPHQGLIQFLQAPPRFGKSTAVSMLKTFFEITVDSLGERVTKTKTPNYDLFTKQWPQLGRSLEISKDDHYMKKHFGEYPVLHLNFKDIDLNDFSEAKLTREIQNSIREAFVNDHLYLLESKKCLCSGGLKSYFDNGEPILTIEDLHVKMSMYLQCLYEHFGKTVMILVDEFDAPVSGAIISNQKIDLDLFSDLFWNFMGYLFKDNDYVFCGFLTGIIRYGDLYPWNAPNIKHKSVFLDEEYAPYIGLNQTEVKELCTRFQQESLYPQLEEWFHGYCVKDRSWKIFNTLSVTKSLQDKKMFKTWTHSEFVHKTVNIFRFENLGQDVWRALQKKSLVVTLAEKISRTKIKTLRDAIQSDSFDRADKDIFLQFFLENGLFSFASSFTSSFESTKEVGVPNKEMQEVLSDRLWVAAKQKYSGLTTALGAFYDSVPQLQHTKESFQKFVNSVASLLQVFSGSPDIGAEFQSVMYCSTVFFLKDAHSEIRVGYFGPEKKGSPERQLKIQEHGVPGIIDYVFLRKNPNTTKNITYELIVIETKFGPRWTPKSALKQCYKGDYSRVCRNKKIIGNVVVTRCFYIGIHLSEENKVSGLMSIADEEKEEEIQADSNISMKKKK